MHENASIWMQIVASLCQDIAVSFHQLPFKILSWSLECILFSSFRQPTIEQLSVKRLKLYNNFLSSLIVWGYFNQWFSYHLHLWSNWEPNILNNATQILSIDCKDMVLVSWKHIAASFLGSAVFIFGFMTTVTKADFTTCVWITRSE